MDTLENRVKQFETELSGLLQKYHLKMNVNLDLGTQTPPEEVQLAIKVLFKYKITYRTSYTEEGK
jgi:hypothetical protein